MQPPGQSACRIAGLRVLVVASSAMLREGLAFTLRSDYGFEVVHTSFLADVPVATGHDPIKVAVISWDRTTETVAQLLACFDALSLDAPVIVLADHAPSPEESASMSNRIAGIVTKHEPIRALVHAIRAAQTGFERTTERLC